MDAFVIASIGIAFVIYAPLCVNIFRGRVQQNLATWLLWTALDFIAALAMYVDGGNWELPALYGFGSFCACVCILRSRLFIWTRFETTVTILVGLCMVIWWLTEAEYATIASTSAIVIASTPTVAEAYRAPEKQPLVTWCGFLLTNGLGILSGKSWTIQERFYPTVCFILCGLFVVLSARGLRRQQAQI